MESETKIASPLEKPVQEATKNEIDLLNGDVFGLYNQKNGHANCRTTDNSYV
jgi:hypothetical protein